MKPKDWIILILISALIGMTILSGVFYFQAKEKTTSKEKIIYIQKPLRVDTLEEQILGLGVTDAWVEYYGADIAADCFNTDVINHRIILTFCKLRKPL